MPTTYTGVEGNVTADRADVTASLPVDGDPRNASSVNTPLQRLADFMQRVRKKAGFLDLASTWTALQTFSAGLEASTADVDGALTAASLNTGSGAISGGPVSGSTVTATGVVTGAHPFTYAAPTTAYFYVDPIQMVADPYGDTADQGRLNEAAIGLGFWETSKIGTVAPTLYMRVPLPRGATITAIGILAYNADIAARSLQSIRVTIVTGGTGAAAPTTAEIQATGAGENISIPSGTNPPVWFAVPLAAGTHVVPSNGYVRMAIDMEETTNRGEQRVYGVRFVCSVPAVRDMT